MLVTKQMTVDIDKYFRKSITTVNFLVINIFQNIFCAQQKKEIHTGLEQLTT